MIAPMSRWTTDSILHWLENAPIWFQIVVGSMILFAGMKAVDRARAIWLALTG
jgi:hypothetical protein